MKIVLQLFLCLACLWGRVAEAARVVSRTKPSRASIVVVRPEIACAPTERGYAATLADRTVRWLEKGGVKAELVNDRSLATTLRGRRLAYLVTCQKPTAAQRAALAQFRAQGGKLVAMQSYAPELAALMACPAQKSAATGPLQVRPAAGGWWVPNAFASTDADEVKARALLTLAAAAVPGCWNAKAWDARQKAQRRAELEYARVQRPRRGEIHAVWDQYGQGLYPGNWPRTMALLKANGVTDIFVNVAGAGFAQYPSRVLPTQSGIVGDPFAACVASAHAVGVRVHAWVFCFTCARATPATRATLAKRGWLLKSRKGVPSEYLNPASPAVRTHLVRAIDELTRRYAVDGVHLDFVRWYESLPKPANAAQSVTEFVGAVRRCVRAARPKAWITAAVFANYPRCVGKVGQNWFAWLDAGLIDYAVPMNYTEKNSVYAQYLARQGHAAKLISGIGVTANESTLDPIQVIDQINLSRRAGTAGVALFDLDPALANQVLPLLRLGLFRP